VVTKWFYQIWVGGSIIKTIHLLHNDNFVSRGLQGTNRKIDKIVTLYRQELLKKRTALGTFCTQSVIQGLISVIVNSSDIFFYFQQVTSNNTDSMMQPNSGAVMNSLVSETKVRNSTLCCDMYKYIWHSVYSNYTVSRGHIVREMIFLWKVCSEEEKFIYCLLSGVWSNAGHVSSRFPKSHAYK